MAGVTTTGNAIGVGVGAVVAVATASFWVPFFGLGVLAAAVGTVGVAAVGAAVGYVATKPSQGTINQLVDRR